MFSVETLARSNIGIEAPTVGCGVRPDCCFALEEQHLVVGPQIFVCRSVQPAVANVAADRPCSASARASAIAFYDRAIPFEDPCRAASRAFAWYRCARLPALTLTFIARAAARYAATSFFAPKRRDVVIVAVRVHIQLLSHRIAIPLPADGSNGD